MNLDETRRKLRVTEMELAKTKRSLESERHHNAQLRARVSELEGKMHTVVGIFFPNHELVERTY